MLNTDRYSWRVELGERGLGPGWRADLETRPAAQRGAHWRRYARGEGADPLEALRALVAAVDEDRALRGRVLEQLRGG